MRRAAQGRRPARPLATRRRSSYFLGPRARAPRRADRRLRHHRGRHRAGAHRAGAFGEEDKVVTDAAGIEPVVPVDAGRQVHRAGRRLRGPARLRRQPGDHRRPQGDDRGHGETGSVTAGTVLLRRETYDHSYPHCWRCRNPLIYRAVSSLVRRGHQVPRPDGRAQPADHLGARARQGRPVRQVAGERPRLVDLPQPVLGPPDPGVESRRPGVPADRRLRLARRARARLRRAARRPAPAVHRRADPAQPGRPDRAARRCAGSPRCWTAGSSPGRCRSPRCTTRSRTPTGSSTTIPGDFIVEYIGQTRGWFYTLHVLATRAVRPAGVPDLRQPRHRARRRRPEDVASRCATTPTSRGLRPRRRRRDALVPDVQPDPARRQPGRHRAGHPRGRAPGADPAVEHAGTSSRCTPTPPGYDRAAVAPTRPTCWTATCWPRPREYVDDDDRASSTTTTSPTPATRRATFLDVLTNWYVRRSRDRFWAADDRDEAAFDTLYTVLETVCRVAAPLLPLTTEEIWRGLTGGRSVHLTDWPVRRRRCPPTTRWSPRWTGCARCARPARRCARPTGCASGCRWPTLTVVVGDAGALAGVRADRGRRGQRQGRPAARRPAPARPRRTASRSG